MAGDVQIRVVVNNLDKIKGELRSEASRKVQTAGHMLASEAKLMMRTPKSGHTYRRGAITTRGLKVGGRAYKKWRGSGAKATFSGGKAFIVTGYRSHRASAPGEAPAMDTGQLVNSIGVSKRGWMTVAVTAHTPYAMPLEFGTRKMAARPFFRPSAAKVQIWLTDAILDIFRRMR